MADRVINIEARFTTDVSNLQGGLQSVQGLLKNLKIPNLSTTKLSSQFESLNEKLKRYKELAEKADTGKVTKTEYNEMKKLGGEIDTLYKNMIKEAGQVGSKITDITSKVNDLKKSIANAEVEMAKLNRSTLADATKENWKGLRQGAVYLKQGKEIDPFERLGTMSSSKQYQQLYSDFMGQIDVGNWKEASSILDNLLSKGSKLQGFRTQFEKTFGKSFTENRLKSFGASLKNILEEAAKVEAPEGIKKFAKEIEKAQAQIQKLVGEGDLQQAGQLIAELKEKVEGSRGAWADIGNALTDFGKRSVSTAEQVAQLTKRIEYFFGLNNQIQLFKRIVKSAFDTVKELDKTMTETAVVTKFSVGDMWAQLPQYTAAAKELGATINDLYAANTLYYQQGLNSTQAMQLGTETLKMARIAGLDAAEATNAMTAALRGFNMTLNDTSAQRVNDVYSKLAANTASNVEEISTAVEKTASLAYSAGMDLEQTSAFLAQIIETTREAPETAGTALKTIIARFGEVKKLHGEGLITGVDEEGEEINVNRVDEALKTAGISLRDFIAGNESLADVFLKLSQRWDSLTLEQQRYIATQSAGARQQSRFIAMMQNTARTQELLDYAYNAEGASSEQFDKTLEGLEAKLNQLKDAWQQFTMGMANQQLIKVAVDSLTWIIEKINTLTTAIGKVGGIFGDTGESITKTTASLLLFVQGFRGVSKLIYKGIGGFGEFLKSNGNTFSFSRGLKEFTGVVKEGAAGRSARIAEQKALRAKEVAEAVKTQQEVETAKTTVHEKATAQRETMDEIFDDRRAQADAMKQEAIEKQRSAIHEKGQAERDALEVEDAVTTGPVVGTAGEEAEQKTRNVISAAGDAERGAASVSSASFWGKLAGTTFGTAFLVAIPVAAVLGLLFGLKQWRDKAKEAAIAAGDEVKENWKKISKESTENLSFLEQNKDRFKTLSEGVDEYGRNLSLTTDEYREYKEISDKVGKMVPELTKKHTEMGEALIGQADAYELAMQKEQEYFDEGKREYASIQSLGKTLEAAKVAFYDDVFYGKGFSGYTNEEWNDMMPDYGDLSEQEAELLRHSEKGMKHTFDSLLETFKLNTEKFTDKASSIIDANGRKIDFSKITYFDYKYLKGNKEKIIKQWSEDNEELKKQLEFEFGELEKEANRLAEQMPSIVDQLNAYLDYNNLSIDKLSIPAEFATSFNNGLEELVFQNLVIHPELGVDELVKQTESYAKSFGALTGPGSRYANIMDKINKAQQEYLDNIEDGEDAVNKYKSNTNNLVEELRGLGDEFRKTNEFGEQLCENFYDQAAAVSSFATSVGIDLNSALNTMDSFFSKSAKAYEDYQKQIETDYYTNANNYASVIEKVLDENESAGFGSNTFWESADLTIAKRITKKGVDAVKAQAETVQGWVKEGEEGYLNFTGWLHNNKDSKRNKGFYTENANGTFNLDLEKATGNLDEFADFLGVTSDMASAMLEKYKQFLKIDFSNPERALKSYQTSGEATETNNGAVYLSRSRLERDFIRSGYGETQAKELAEKYFTEYKNQFKLLGVKALTGQKEGVSVEEYISATKTGNAQDLIKNLLRDSGGDFTLKNIRDIVKASQYGTDVTGQEWSEEQISEWYEQATVELQDGIQSGLEEFVDPTIETATNTKGIYDILSAMAQSQGVLSPEMEENIRNELSGQNIDDLINKISSGDTPIEAIGTKQKDLQLLVNALEKTKQIAEENGDTETIERTQDLINDVKSTQESLLEKTKTLIDSRFPTNTRDPNDVKEPNQEKIAYKDNTYSGAMEHFGGLSEGLKTALKLELDNEGEQAVINSLERLGFEKEGAELIARAKLEFVQPDSPSPEQTTLNKNQKPDGDIGSLPDLSGGIKDEMQTGFANGVATAPDEFAKTDASNVRKNVTNAINTGIANASKIVRIAPVLTKSTLSILGSKGDSVSVKLFLSGSKGINLDTIPILPSYAKGRIKGGKETALTGETGYEVAWFPSQGTSTILGLNGPEMVDLPKDAVVFPHNQSKKILKGNPNRPQLGSHDEDPEFHASGQINYGSSGGGGSKSSTKKDVHRAAQAAEETAKGTKKNLAKWTNLELQLKQIQNRLDLNLDKIKKYLEKDPNASEKGLKSKDFYQQYVDDLKAERIRQKALYDKYNKKLNSAVSKTKGNKTEISVGKKKEKVSLNKYITKDVNGDFIIDEKELKKIAKKNKKRAQAIRDAAQKLIEDLLGKRDSAKKAELDAIDKGEDLQQLINDTFYNWEFELRKINELAMQLEVIQKRIAREQKAQDLEYTRAKAGYSDASTIPMMIEEMERERQLIYQQANLSRQKTDEARKNMLELLYRENYLGDKKQAFDAAQGYYSVNRREDGSLDVSIDWARLEKERNTGDLSEGNYQKIKDVLDGIHNGVTNYEDAIGEESDNLKAIYDKIVEFKENEANLADEALKGLQKEIDKEISNAKTISASITNALKDLYDQVKKEIDRRRKAEDNAKTEQDIQKKQQRLAMLRADTSGSNALEIAQLEKEIGDAQQNYQRSLEDQLLQNLQDQADIAAKQREEIISITEAVNNSAEAMKEKIALIEQWFDNGEYEKILDAVIAARYDDTKMTKYRKSLIEDEAKADVSKYISAKEINKGYEELADTIEENGALEHERQPNAPEVTGFAEKIIKEILARDQAAEQKRIADTIAAERAAQKEAAQKTYNNILANAASKPEKDKNGNYIGTKQVLTKDILNNMFAQGATIGKTQKQVVKDLADTNAYTWTDVLKAAKKAGIDLNTIRSWSKSDKFKKAFEKVFGVKYATGGLNTTTGPAWLDGTKSKPELVLNATDTKNFLQLKDVLSHVMKGAAALPDTFAGESNTYEININVDHLNNDYDVDKVAERVKKIIVKDSSYRNVTAVRKFR